MRRARNLSVVVAALAACWWPATAAALSAGNVTITAVTPFAAVDSNACAGGAGPHAMYLEVTVKNNTAATLSNVSATLNGFPASAATPPSPPTAFTLDLGESATRLIGSLSAGATAPLYWYVNYPCTLPPASGSSISYTVTVSDSNPGTVTSSTLTLTTRSELSANAGGNVTNQTIGVGIVLGQTVTVTVNYTYGNPSSQADTMIQPAGNVSFDSGCFRLIKTTITSSTFTTGPLTTASDQLYFSSVSGGSSNSLTVNYQFLALCVGSTSVLNPFADLKSGGQEKYTGNFGSCVSTPCDSTFSAPTNPFTISKSAAPTSLATGGTVTYTVTITNTSNFDSTVQSIADVLPSGVTYGGLTAGSTVQASNSASVPSAGATGTISWVGQPSTQYAVPANSSITLGYTVSVPNTSGLYTNSVTASIGNVTVGPATSNVVVGATLTPTATATNTPTSTASATATTTATNTATPTNSPTATFTATSTKTQTATATSTATPSATGTTTNTPTATASSTGTATATSTATATASSTATATATQTFTNTATATQTSSATPTSTDTSTATPTATGTTTDTPTATASSTGTATATSTATATASDTATATQSSTVTPTSTETSTATPTATGTATDTPTATASFTGTATATNTTTATATQTSAATATQTFTATATSTETATATATATGTAADTPTATASSTGTATATASDTATATPTDTATPADTATATAVSTDTATATATSTSADTPTATQTTGATASPSDTATATPNPPASATATPTATDTPPTGASPTPAATSTPCSNGVADVVFVLDTSVSMRLQVNKLWPTILGPLPEQLTAAGIDWRMAVVRFGTGHLHNGPDAPDVALDFTSSGDAFRATLASFAQQIYGPTESGTEAIDLALSSLTLRPGAAHLFIVFTDENDDLPVSVVRGPGREPPRKWLTSPRRPMFQTRLDASAQGLINAQVMLDLVINPKFKPSAFQYGSPAATVLDGSGALDVGATLAALTAAQQQQSLQGQLLAAGTCSAGSCTRGRLGAACAVDTDCGLRARAFDIRAAHKKTQGPILLQSVVSDLMTAVRCGP